MIRVLGEAEALEAADLADRACVLAPSLTRIIKTLEDRGLISRQRHETDGRRVLLEITPAGVALIRSVTPESAKIYVELEARFGRERLDQLLDLLETLTRNGGR
jgi:homoprotocatechuate degradation regulator HpaR